MRKNKVVFKKDKGFDKLVAQFLKEKTVNLVVKFNTILDRLQAENKINYWDK